MEFGLVRVLQMRQMDLRLNREAVKVDKNRPMNSPIKQLIAEYDRARSKWMVLVEAAGAAAAIETPDLLELSGLDAATLYEVQHNCMKRRRGTSYVVSSTVYWDQIGTNGAMEGQYTAFNTT